jgi:hypothetical protein
MPRGCSGKSMFGVNSSDGISSTGVTSSGGISSSSGYPSYVTEFLYSLNTKTKDTGKLKTVEDVQKLVGIFNATIANIAVKRKTIVS